jgi:hypothetical protein
MYNEMLGLSLASAVGARAVISKADGMTKLLECVQNILEPKTDLPVPTTSAAPAGNPAPVPNEQQPKR